MSAVRAGGEAIHYVEWLWEDVTEGSVAEREIERRRGLAKSGATCRRSGTYIRQERHVWVAWKNRIVQTVAARANNWATAASGSPRRG